MNENGRFKSCNECMFFAEVERGRGKECTFNGFDADDYEQQYFENYCCTYKKDGGRKVTKKKKREKKNLRRSGFALFEFCKVDGVGVPVGKRFRQEQFWGKINI